MKRTKPPFYSILIRYLILLILAFSLPIFYKILTPLTLLSTSNILGIFYNISTTQDIIVINSQTFIQLIPACIAGSAYLLLIILNLTIPLSPKKRAYSLIFSILTFYLINILRITLLSVWYHEGLRFFNITHTLTWYIGSTLLILMIWFITIKLFSIKEIPVYTDFKNLINVRRK